MRGIYHIKHKDSQRFYVGSSEDIDKRLTIHIANLRGNRHHCKYLQNCWNKYGEMSFEFYPVEEVLEGSLTDREQHHIDTTPKELLLNGSRCAARPLDDPEVKIKQKKAVSEYSKNRWKDDVYRNKMVEILNNRDKLRVVNLNTGEVYRSVKDAQKAVGACGIYDAISGGGTCGGFYWDYKDKPVGNSVREDVYKRVVRLDTGEIFKNAKVAAKILGFTESCIYNAIGRSSWCCGTKWDFLDEPVGNTNDPTPSKHYRPVRRLDTGEVFEGATIASLFYRANKNSVASCIRRGVRFQGTYWEYADGNPKSLANKKPSKVYKTREKRPVINLETGETFTSCEEASNKLGVSKSAIYNKIFHKKGWKYLDTPKQP